MNEGREWKTRHWTTEKPNSLVKNIGEELAIKIANGELRIKETEKALITLFDTNGQRITDDLVDLDLNFCEPNAEFYLKQPEMETAVHYTNRLLKLRRAFTGIWHSEQSSAIEKIVGEQFKQETERLLILLQEDRQVANIVNGVWLPVVLPPLATDDIGEALEQYLRAVNKSYRKAFGDKKFYKHCEGDLAGHVSVVDGSRYGQLIERMRQEAVVGIYFPDCLRRLSIDGSIQQMPTLSDGFYLSGFSVIAGTMYPKCLFRDWHTSVVDLASFRYRGARSSLYLKAHDDFLFFGLRGFLSRAYARSSGGLFFCR